MRESTETVDQIAVTFGMFGKRLHKWFPLVCHTVNHLFIGINGPILIERTFTMGEGMRKKNLPRDRQLLIQLSVECSYSRRACKVVLHESFSTSPKHVSRKLIQYDDDGQRALRVLTPVQQPPLPNRGMHAFESLFDIVVNSDRRSIPETVSLLRGSRIRFGGTKPVRNHVGRLVYVFRHTIIVPKATPAQTDGVTGTSAYQSG